MDSEVFSEIDLEPANTTDTLPVTTSSAIAKPVIPDVSSKSNLPTDILTTDAGLDTTPSTVVHPTPSTSSCSQQSPISTKQFYSKSTGLPPFPIAQAKTTKRKISKLPSLVISSTPVKTALERVAEEKLEKERKRIERNEKLLLLLSFTVEYIDNDDDNDPLNLENEKLCIICDDSGKDNELWFRCFKCSKWAHAECTGLNQKEAKHKTWFCDFCN